MRERQGEGGREGGRERREGGREGERDRDLNSLELGGGDDFGNKLLRALFVAVVNIVALCSKLLCAG